MLAKVFSGGILGLEAKIIEIEVSTSYGLRHFEILDFQIKQSMNRKKGWGQQLRVLVLNLLQKSQLGF